MKRIVSWLLRYLNIYEPEVQISFVLVALITILSIILQFYNIFIELQDAINNLLLYFIGGFIGLLGVLLTGITVVIGIFSKKELDTINQSNNVDCLAEVLSSFRFCALNVGVIIFYLVFIYFLVCSPIPLVGELWFYLLFMITLYMIIFTLFYIISLINETIDLYMIKQQYTVDVSIQKNTIDKANEIRIDYILDKLIKNKQVNPNQFIEDISSFIDKSNITNKDEIKKYINDYYK